MRKFPPPTLPPATTPKSTLMCVKPFKAKTDTSALLQVWAFFLISILLPLAHRFFKVSFFFLHFIMFVLLLYYFLEAYVTGLQVEKVMSLPWSHHEPVPMF
jgi:ABC-type uncharacterized transport system permease subunit